MPVLNRILSKEQMKKLLVGEHFREVSFEDEDLKKYVPVLVSENLGADRGDFDFQKAGGQPVY